MATCSYDVSQNGTAPRSLRRCPQGVIRVVDRSRQLLRQRADGELFQDLESLAPVSAPAGSVGTFVPVILGERVGQRIQGASKPLANTVLLVPMTWNAQFSFRWVTTVDSTASTLCEPVSWKKPGLMDCAEGVP